MADYSTMDIPKIERHKSSPTCMVLLSDFANMLKAFIGANYLTIAYAFTQSGLVPGIILLTVIAAITNHCCHLIVKCKYQAIQKLLDRRREFANMQSSQNGDISAELAAMRQKLVRNMTYGDVGRIAFGGGGLLVVNICLMFTQFGFCVGYFIFLGNTMYHLFPFKNTTLPYDMVPAKRFNASSLLLSSAPSSESDPSYSYSLNNASHSDGLVSNLVERSADGLMDQLTNLTSTAASFINELVTNLTSTTTVLPPTVTSTANANTTTTTTMITTTTTATHEIIASNISHFIEISQSPDLRLLVITPLPIFIGFAFLRDIRHLGFVSVAADIAIFIGCVVTMIVLNMGFVPSDTWMLTIDEWTKLPVFFGMVTSAFEGIGTIIPIESSMEGNRHNFNRFLHGAVFIMLIILLAFGILGYLRYGDETAQMINKNMPDGTVGVLINICLCIGVVLTFPLQIYPVIELSEIYLFGNDRICGPNTRKHRRLSEVNDKANDYESDSESSDEDGESLIPRNGGSGNSHAVAMTVSDEVSTWKRNLLRIVLVIAAGGVAIVLRDLYAYVSAFIGALGSSVLAYILPCLFHLKLCWSVSPKGVLVKDVCIVVFGVIASLFSLYSTIEQVIDRV